jgi:hypothetical protein
LTIEPYKNERASIGKAAELAGITYDNFYAAVKERDTLYIGPRSQKKAEPEYNVVKG